MKKLATYIILIFAFSTLLVGCSASKKCGCPTFGQKEMPNKMMASNPSYSNNLNQALFLISNNYTR